MTTTTLTPLFDALCTILSDDFSIEANAKKALQDAIAQTSDTHIDLPHDATPLAPEFLEVMAKDDAHPICQLIKDMPFHWVPPQTSSDPLYQQHSLFKAHVELLGPTGLVPSSSIRMGLYGMLPHAEYGIRTHPAEETYIMLAGNAFWIRGDNPYQQAFAGERSYHPSMMPHATKTEKSAFMSIYIWDGDIATDNYQYLGLPRS